MSLSLHEELTSKVGGTRAGVSRQRGNGQHTGVQRPAADGQGEPAKMAVSTEDNCFHQLNVATLASVLIQDSVWQTEVSS